MQPIYKKRIAKISIIIGMVAVGITLILKTFNDNVMFFYTPTDLIEKNIKASNKIIRVGGFVKSGSIKRQDNSLDVTFTMTDNKNELTVNYTGILPNLFKDGQGSIAKGILRDRAEFIAEEILAKHDEKYIPKEVVDRLKEQNLWEGD
ncbi:MAG: cytochrome c maturation protein CcmE [Alphaproteobacteria bacterium]|jgi:cytochrome c-type biogenesis protein CcmE|nr:cytochrome c maturation protein CcmE [Candidatus Jidaibacter sp.]